ncbi:hypothetical protein GCM10010335_19680 [Streptomyces galbus]|nr:hypothetical protein GCM10010335_19680 [Streptomyces galbus]
MGLSLRRRGGEQLDGAVELPEGVRGVPERGAHQEVAVDLLGPVAVGDVPPVGGDVELVDGLPGEPHARQVPGDDAPPVVARPLRGEPPGALRARRRDGELFLGDGGPVQLVGLQPVQVRERGGDRALHLLLADPGPRGGRGAGDHRDRDGEQPGEGQQPDGERPAAGAVVRRGGEVPPQEEQQGERGGEHGPHQADGDADEERAELGGVGEQAVPGQEGVPGQGEPYGDGQRQHLGDLQGERHECGQQQARRGPPERDRAEQSDRGQRQGRGEGAGPGEQDAQGGFAGGQQVAVEADQRPVPDREEPAGRAGAGQPGHEQQHDGEAGQRLGGEDPPG